MRQVRKRFRKEVFRLVSTGDGNTETLMKIAEVMFGDVGYPKVLETFWRSELSNAVSFLRNEGLIETIGKQWKPIETLNTEDVEIISVRRLKRLRGELKAEVRLAHDHGLVEDAVLSSKMLDLVSQRLEAEELADVEEQSAGVMRSTVEPDGSHLS